MNIIVKKFVLTVKITTVEHLEMKLINANKHVKLLVQMEQKEQQIVVHVIHYGMNLKCVI